MNKVCKEYISDAKKFFPIMGKSERAYLRGIVSELEDCIKRESITSKQELYVKYRQPYDLANDYYSRFETDEIVKKIRISKYIKVFISVLIAVILLGFSFYMYVWNHHQYMSLREEMVDSKEQIVQNNTINEKDHDVDQSDNFIFEDEQIIEEEIIE